MLVSLAPRSAGGLFEWLRVVPEDGFVHEERCVIFRHEFEYLGGHVAGSWVSGWGSRELDTTVPLKSRTELVTDCWKGLWIAHFGGGDVCCDG